MKICGFQKLTLLDFPLKTACTVFTSGCNLRCPFCHNASLVIDDGFEEAVTHEEFMEFLQKRKKVLDGVCITGGEPLMQEDIEEFIREIKGKGYLVKLDTNGCFPQKLKSIVEKGLVDYVAIDIKSSIENYHKAVGIKGNVIDNVKISVEYLMEGHVDFEFRTTVVNGIHTAEDFESIGKWLRGNEKYYLQEYVDSGDTIEGRNGRNNLSEFSEKKMKLFAEIVRKNIPHVEIRGI